MYAKQSHLRAVAPRTRTRRRLVLAARIALLLITVALVLFAPDARAHGGPGVADVHHRASP